MTHLEQDCISQPLAGCEVKNIGVEGKSDFSDWVDLMEAIELLCPTWPAPSAQVDGLFRM